MKGPLIQLLKQKALKRLDEPIQLASGAWSQEFVDGKEALSNYEDLELACQTMAKVVAARGVRFDAVGGLTLGADALAVGIAAAVRCHWFIVRKKTKERGTGRRIEGAQIGVGWRVLLVDDVVTSGGSILQALESIQEAGAEVVAATTLVDRGDVASREFEKLGIPYLPMATYADLGIPAIDNRSQGVSTHL